LYRERGEAGKNAVEYRPMSSHPTRAADMTSDPPIRLSGWALVLGGSSGFGEATALALAGAGMSVAGVHLDRKATLPNAERIAGEIRRLGGEALFFNVNAADADRRGEVLDALQRHLEERGAAGQLRVLLHSLAFGTLKPFIAEPVKEAVSKDQMDMTLDVMAHSLVYWTQDVVARGLMREGGRVFAMTSGGGTRVLPSYGPVSGAKAALESHVRQLAMELAPRRITVNAVRAGVTDTPALQKIPGSDRIKAGALARNPSGRLTTPADVGAAIVAFAHSSTHWMTGNVLGVDGGEDVVG
jgi:enoyl-[acyl-carrier protein] reductase III